MKLIPLLITILAAICSHAVTAAPPNILVVHTDDIGWGDPQCYNAKSKIPTPNIDRLAQAGMRFTDAHTSAVLCGPTRYSMLTGNYPARAQHPQGVWAYHGPVVFKAGQKTVAQMLQSAGYRTATFGKLNMGGAFATVGDTKEIDWSKPMVKGPLQWGFDESFISSAGHSQAPYFFIENNRVVGDPAQVRQLKRDAQRGITKLGPGLPDWDSRTIGERIAKKAFDFLDAHQAKNKASGKDQPFYIYFNTDGSHGPYTPPDKLLGTPVKGVSKMTAHTDMIAETDVLLGKLVEALEQRGLLANTLVVYTSDNGGLPFEREFGHDAVGGLRGCKSFLYEGGHRVPFIVRRGRWHSGGFKNPARQRAASTRRHA